jgi:hypothetical protein
LQKFEYFWEMIKRNKNNEKIKDHDKQKKLN